MVNFLPLTWQVDPQRWARPPCFGRRRCDHDVTMQVHESSQPIIRCKAWQPRAGSAVDRFWTGCHVDAMAAVWQNHIGKNIKITHAFYSCEFVFIELNQAQSMNALHIYFRNHINVESFTVYQTILWYDWNGYKLMRNHMAVCLRFMVIFGQIENIYFVRPI